jgi:hypothetical protein
MLVRKCHTSAVTALAAGSGTPDKKLPLETGAGLLSFCTEVALSIAAKPLAGQNLARKYHCRTSLTGFGTPIRIRSAGWLRYFLVESASLGAFRMPVPHRAGLLLLAIVPWFLGCEDEEMAWTPDSSALVYRDETKGWSRYDLKAKSTKQLLKSTTRGAQGIAVSPRGDQFVVGTVTAKKEKNLELQLKIYSRTGELAQESLRFAIGKYDTDYVPDGLWLEWSTGPNSKEPDGRIAVFAGTGIALYDAKTKKLRWLKDYAPYHEGMYIGSNLVPDGSGLIVNKIDPNAAQKSETEMSLPDVVLIDWDGRIVRTTKVPQAPSELRKLLGADQKICLSQYAVWSGQTCQLQLHDYRLDVTPKTGIVQWTPNPLRLDKHVPGYDSQASYVLLPVGAGGWYVYWKNKDQASSLELMNVKTKAHQVLVKEGEVNGAVRSPDGNKLAITFVDKSMDKDAKQQTTIIVDENGKKIATLARGEIQLIPEVPAAPAPEAAPAPAPAPPAKSAATR